MRRAEKYSGELSLYVRYLKRCAFSCATVSDVLVPYWRPGAIRFRITSRNPIPISIRPTVPDSGVIATSETVNPPALVPAGISNPLLSAPIGLSNGSPSRQGLFTWQIKKSIVGHCGHVRAVRGRE